MKRALLLSLAFACLSIGAVSQSLRHPISAVYLGLSAYSTQHSDAFSFVGNQASLARVKQAAAGVYGERRFLLQATSVYAAAAIIPSSLGNFGINIKYAGFASFNESQVGLAYARSLGTKIAIGVQFNYYGYRIPAYPGAATINFEIGTMVHITPQLNLGIHVYNPVGGKFSKTGEKLTGAYKMGLGYDASEQFFVAAEIIKEEDYPVNLNAGVQYRFAKQFFLRTGISSASPTGYAGVGVAWNQLRLDICGSYHPQLGLSPGLLLIMSFGDKE